MLLQDGNVRLKRCQQRHVYAQRRTTRLLDEAWQSQPEGARAFGQRRARLDTVGNKSIQFSPFVVRIEALAVARVEIKLRHDRQNNHGINVFPVEFVPS